MEQYRIDTKKGLEFGLYSIGDHTPNPHTGSKISSEQRIKELIEASNAKLRPADREFPKSV